MDYAGFGYIIYNGKFRRYDPYLAPTLMCNFNCENNKEGVENMYRELCDKLNIYE
jgi:hypothetical protein